MTELTAQWVLALLLAAALTGIVLVVLEGRRERLGRNAHAHADGTVHEHYRGSAAHRHPSTLERYDALLDRILGPR